MNDGKVNEGTGEGYRDRGKDDEVRNRSEVGGEGDRDGEIYIGELREIKNVN